ncbi:MAG: hypothetical protein KDJ36_15790 [Hyphomicrobiaceae bacterium]|nr:hypothetical protein [Hyphomicrobiaceae bacterium]
MLSAAIVLAALMAACIQWLPAVRASRLWRATVTPLASIIGSGFLILGPVMSASFGAWAPAAMLALCALAWAFGWAIRYNICAREADARQMPGRLERAASWSLAFSYIISVTYYLNLLGAFGVRLTPYDDQVPARVLTTAVFVLIMSIGWWRGFRALENLERVSVGLKLSIIAGLLVGLAIVFGERSGGGTLMFSAPKETGWSAVTLLFGLIVTVQGFETSRYLGQAYDAGMRIRSMRVAQGISSLIYVLYIGLFCYLFSAGDMKVTETAIIDLIGLVAPVLPVLLIAAALSSQFSAAVADTGGSGGLFQEVTGGRLSERRAYLLVGGVGLLLTWTANVFQIVSYASRAFALYYGLQAAIAAVTAWRRAQPLRAVMFCGLAVLGAAITVLGAPVEGG